MKVTLEFDGDEEKERIHSALKGEVYKMKIDSLYNDVFRPYIKYGNPIVVGEEQTKEHYEAIEHIWFKIQEHFSEEGL
jgi:hypothetical protein